MIYVYLRRTTEQAGNIPSWNPNSVYSRIIFQLSNQNSTEHQDFSKKHYESDT